MSMLETISHFLKMHPDLWFLTRVFFSFVVLAFVVAGAQEWIMRLIEGRKLRR